MTGYMRRDALTALALLVLALALGAGAMDIGHVWGDDFAGYLLEGRAIAQGRLEEQAQLNAILHPSERAFGGRREEGPLVYALGLPALLALIFRATGCVRPEGAALLLFKLPGLLAFAAFAVLLYLFYRRRFGWGASLVLTLLLVLNTEVIGECNLIMTDMLCLTGTVAALLELELLLDETRPRKAALHGTLLGLSLLLTCLVRLNGVTVVVIVLIGHAVGLLTRRSALHPVWRQLLPYALLLGLYGLVHLIFPEPNSNTGHIASGSNAWILHNISYYHYLVRQWVTDMLPGGFPAPEAAVYAFYALIVLGMLTGPVRRNLHFAAFVLGTYAVLYLLPYVQTLRYMFGILPLMLLFAANGTAFLAARIGRLLRNARVRRAACALGCAALVLMTAGMALRTARWEWAHLESGGWRYRHGAYSEDAEAAYDYIRTNTQADERIAFYKPRALYLNTDRVSFAPGVNGNRFRDADYLMLNRDEEIDDVQARMWPELWAELTPVYENDSLILYRISEAYRSAP